MDFLISFELVDHCWFSDFWVFSSTSGPFPGKFAKLSGIIAPPQKGVWGPHAHFDHICTPVFSLSRKAERRAGSSHQARGLLHYYQVPHNMAQCKKNWVTRWQMTNFGDLLFSWTVLRMDWRLQSIVVSRPAVGRRDIGCFVSLSPPITVFGQFLEGSHVSRITLKCTSILELN